MSLGLFTIWRRLFSMLKEDESVIESARDEIAVMRLKKERLELIAQNKCPSGCKQQTFLCPDCSACKGLILDEENQILGIVDLKAQQK